MEFGDGVSGILGQNGVGKSTLVEAVSWALYGNQKEIVRTEKMGIRNALAGPNEECSVTLEFDLETDHYRLVRQLKGTDARCEASLTVNDRLLARTDRGVTETIEQRLGMDHKAFFVSVFARQKELNALSEQKPAERKRTVLRLLGIDVLDSVVSEISSDLKGISSELDGMNQALRAEDGQDRRKVLERNLEELQSSHQQVLAQSQERAREAESLEPRLTVAIQTMRAAESRSEEHGKLNNRAVALTTGTSAHQARQEAISKELERLTDRARGLIDLERQESRLLAVEGEIKGLQEASRKKVRKDGLEQTLVQTIKDLDRREVELIEKREALGRLKDPETRLHEIEEAIAGHESALQSGKQNVVLLQGEISRKQKEEKEKRAQLQGIIDLGPSSPCPTCQRPLELHHPILLAHLEEEGKELKRAIAELEQRQSIASAEVQRFEERRKAADLRRRDALRDQATATSLRAEIGSLERSQAEGERRRAETETALEELGEVILPEGRLKELEEEQSGLRQDQQALTRLRTELARRSELDAEGRTIAEKLVSEREELQVINDKMRALAYSPTELTSTRQEYQSLRDAQEGQRREAERWRAEAERKKGEMTSVERSLRDLAELETKALALRQKQTELSTLMEVMREFRAHVTSRVVPTLSHTTSELFVELTEGKYGGIRLDENYEMQVLDQGVEYPMGRFSGGETDLANLCLRLAISRLLAERSGRHINFLVLDEIFGSQDNMRKRSILNLLSSLQKQFGQIILITHIEDVKEGVERVILVEEGEDGTSVIENR